jgi:glycerophosphoryl diester phosphodiesterase
MPPRVIVFGHGSEDGSGPAINTIESYGWCREQGADGVELDVRRTSDDELAVVHDAVLPDGRLVGSTAFAELPPHIPRLADVLDQCVGLIVNIELKIFPSDPEFDPTERLTRLVIDLLRARGGSDRVLVSCFGLGAIDLVKAQAPECPTAALLLSRRPAPDLLGAVVAHGHTTVHPYDTMVGDVFMTVARQHGLVVNPWIGEVGPERMRTLVNLGVDGLITADVATARAVVDQG